MGSQRNNRQKMGIIEEKAKNINITK